MDTTVAGGGIVGCVAALALGRAGHDVTVIEPDGPPEMDGAASALAWRRPGCPQFAQPHVVLSLAARTLETHAPDVVTRLLAVGARRLDANIELPAEHHDPDLTSFAARRPLIEWAVRTALAAEPTVRWRTGRISGLIAEPSAQPVVTGVRLHGGATLTSDAVVDATGRSSPFPGWLGELGAHPVTERANDSNAIYFSRYYRRRPDAPALSGATAVPARGDLGFAGFVTFLEEDDVVGVVVVVPPWDRELRVLRDDRAFTAIVEHVPMLAAVIGAEVATPITSVLPMGAIRNTLRSFVDANGEPVALGVLAIGDSRSHTNPMYATGLSFGLAQAFELPALIDAAADLRALGRAVHVGWHDELRDRVAFASAVDGTRGRAWRGERIDPGDRAANPEFFVAVATSIVALADPALRRRVLRRNACLDTAASFDRDEELLASVEARFEELRPHLPPPAIDRAGLLAAATGARG